MKLICTLKLTTAFAALSVAPFAMAHEGAHHHANWFSGLLHPLTGADHLLAMVMMGVVAALLKPTQANKLFIAIAACFVAGFTLSSQLMNASFLEPVLMASVVFIPIAAFTIGRSRLLQMASLIMVAAFGASHGAVLGVEVVGSVVLFGAGATFTSLALCGLGFGTAKLIQQWRTGSAALDCKP